MKNMYKSIISKMSCLILIGILFSSQLSLASTAQSIWEVSLDLELNDEPLTKAFEEIEAKTDFTFNYSMSDVKAIKLTNKYKDVSLGQILTDFSKKGKLKFRQIGQHINVNKLPVEAKSIPIEVVEIAPIEVKVTDENGEPLVGVTVVIQGTSNGAVSDFNGIVRIDAEQGAELVVSYVGFQSQNITVGSATSYEVVLLEDLNQLESITVTGSRNENRSVTDTPVPIDVIDMEEIVAPGGQISITEILNVVAPSFTSQTQTVSDGTDHLDPASLRGLGPDQVLVLINGKRRHVSSLLNVNGTVGRGSVGTDMNSLPTAAIKRIEVLRDGAAAQYGSDAIAGVINIILKDATDQLDLTVTTGANFSSNSNQFDGGVDGEKIQIDANYGIPLGDGFINFTGSLGTRTPALRNRDYQGDIFQGFHGAERLFAASGGTVADMTMADYQSAATGLSYLGAEVLTEIAELDVANADDVTRLRELLGTDVDEAELAARGLTREDFRFKIGTAQLREGKAFANMSLPIGENGTEFYAFGGIGYRQGLASGFYRRPAQGDGRANTPAFPNGFLPGIQSDVLDQSVSVGIKSKINDWKVDFSNTYGSNTFDITVVNSSNGTLGVATPRDFRAGGFGFSQNTTNLDVSKFHDNILEGFNVAFGAEYRVENFQVTAGEEASWANYDVNGNIINAATDDALLVRNNFTGATLGGGSQVYRGFTPQNEVNQFRNSIAGYFDFEADVTEALILSFATRFESYSDFGETFNYKVAGRYQFSENLAIRGAQSTGFRAPSLHQKFFSRSSTVFVNGEPNEIGTFSNDSRAAQLLGIPNLKEETSTSSSVGLVASLPGAGLTLTVDAYQIDIEDRIVISGSFRAGDDPELQQIFEAAGSTSAQFLTNAIDTKSQGLDITLSQVSEFGNATLKNDFAATFSKTEQVGDINTTPLLAGQESTFFGARDRLFLERAQPRTKVSLTNMFTMNQVTGLLRNVYYGSVIDPDSHADDALVEYGGKLVTDLSLRYGFSDVLSATIGVNNLFDIYPDENREASTSGDQFVYSRRTSQFGYTGRFMFLKVNFTLK